jgi:hypothetical protein
MKAFHPFIFGAEKAANEEKQRFAEIVAQRGSTDIPPRPRDLMAQSGARKVLLTWSLAEGDEITARWRIYKDTESNLVMEIADRGTRQMFLDVTSGATPPTVNFFVSGLSKLGTEGPKVQVQGKATVEAGAPSDPAVPPGYTSGSAGGGDTSYDPNPTRSGGRTSRGDLGL